MKVMKNYARGLIEAVMDAKGAAEMDAVRASVKLVSETISGSKELRDVLYGPMVAVAVKEKIISDLCDKSKAPAVVQTLFVIMAKKGRLKFVAELPAALEHAWIERQGGLVGVVETADDISKPELDSLAESFENKTGKKVQFDVKKDPTLLAGLKVTISGVTYDGTLKSQLVRLHENFLR